MDNKKFTMPTGEEVTISFSHILNHSIIRVVIEFTAQNCNTKGYYYTVAFYGKRDFSKLSQKEAENYFKQAQRRKAIAA